MHGAAQRVKRERLFDGRPLSEDDIELVEEYWAAEARKSLWAYRQYMDPTMIRGWWVAHISKELQDFFIRMKNGERPKLLIEAPPQHGKSRGLHDGIGWFSGQDPDLKTIYGSFSDELGTTANTILQRAMDTDKYRRVFPGTRIPSLSGRGDEGYSRNSTLIEYVGRKGSFRNTTVRGQVTGKTLGLGVVDDPIKGREEAQSKLQRDKAWNWLMDDFFSRFSDDAGFIMTMTRWHVDDPAGRWLLHFPETRVLKYPALFEPTPAAWRNDAYDPRAKGEPLFPEYKSKPFLMERKKSYTVTSWQSLYQQMPIVAGGGMFPIEKFAARDAWPAREDVDRSIRYWDKAGTEAGGAYTCGVLMHKLTDGTFAITDVKRGQWTSLDREKQIKATTEADRVDWGRVETWIEQEPGSGGKESAERTVAMLAGFPCYIDKVTGSKEIRAEPYAAQVQAGHVRLTGKGQWKQEFIDEHEVFPTGKYKDQVDAAAGAFNKLVVKKYKYDASLSWVGGPTVIQNG
jgi:predicted phage terminase large subunit-like protein